MGFSLRCFYSADFYLDLPDDHPFPKDKFRLSKDMLLESRVLTAEEIVEVEAAPTHVLQRAHDLEYLDKIYRGMLDRKEQVQLGLPLTPKLYTRSATEVEATRMACEAALEEGISVVLAGGTHHAFRGHGEGYCVFNDIAIAIRSLQLKQPGIKVMVVDTAAHQGNGTNSLLDHDPDVFTYSIHVGRNGERKVEGSMDVETVRYVEGDMYLQQLFSTLATALTSFSPDLVVWIAGVDNHRNDRFGEMLLSVRDLQRRDEVLLDALVKNRIPVAVLYGGGYNRQAEYSAKLHRNTVATAKRIARKWLAPQ